MAFPTLGASVEGDGVRFRVWGPGRRAELVLEDGRRVAMAAGADVHEVRVGGIGVGARYRFSLDGGAPMPDPASRFQPDGVHGPSEVVDPSRYAWRDAGWRGVALRDLVVYELHVGTFTPEGTFDATRRRLPELAALGVSAIELMPLSDFAGNRGWGYDPAALFAPCRAYGRPDDLRLLVDEAHSHGLAVLVDVVYNHLGPDGAFAAAYGPVLLERGTPWGAALDLEVTAVRQLVVQSALAWLREYHADGLRLDATFALVDPSDEHVLAELARRAESLEGPPRFLIAEDDRNLARIVEPRNAGGYGLDAQWADDFHHLVRRVLTGDTHRYFPEYPASTAALARCIEEGFWFTGQESPYRGGPHGTAASHLPPERFVFCIQNHDQIGNRPRGERLSHDVDLATYRAASALLLFVPQIPLLFMGQEHAASAPFRYFVDHRADIARSVRAGRRRVLAEFPDWDGDMPDPQAPGTFAASVLDWGERRQSPFCEVLRLYRDLLALRKTLPPRAVRASSPVEGLLLVERGPYLLAACLKGRGAIALPWPARLLLDTEEERYGGAALSIARPQAPLGPIEGYDAHREPPCRDRPGATTDLRPALEGTLALDGPRALVVQRIE